MYEQLKETVYHVPPLVAFSLEFICSTARLRVPCCRDGALVPAAILPLNLITLCPGRSEDIGTYVCSRFDISVCAMVLHVSAEHKYYFKFHHRADEAVRSQRLQLLPEAFSPSRASVRVQMVRVVKYLARGFHW